MDVVTLGAALNGSKKYIDQVEQSLESDLSLKANISDVNATTANLQAQINQIAQAAGTGSADTEVAQARIGAGGTTYNTLKARLDGENSELKENLSVLNKVTYTIIEGKYVSSSTGILIRNANYNSVILPVIEGDVYSYNGLTKESIAGYALYKGDPSEGLGIFISGGAGTVEPQNIIIPQGVNYAAFSYRANSSAVLLDNLLKYTGNLYHISKQLSLLGIKISDINPNNLKNNGVYVPDKYIVGATGTIASWTQQSGVYGYSEYVVASGGTITYKADRNEIQAGYAFYDSRGAYISGGLGTNTVQTLTVPEGATIGRFTTTNPTNVIALINIFDILYRLTKYQAPMPSLVLPTDSIAVVGHEYNIFYDNVIDGYTDQYYLDARIADITNSTYVLSDCIRILPTLSDVGTHTLTIRLIDRITRTVIDTKTINIHVIADSSLANKKVLFIGDSLTDAGYYPAEIQHNLSNGGIISLGTRQDTVVIGGQNLTVNHEGRSGWATYDYTEISSRSGVSNAFWDGEKFNFSYYMQQQGYGSVDAVCIGLGTNGGDTQRMYDAMDTIISSIREFSQTVKILIALTCPPASQDGCGKNNHTQSSAELKHNFLNVVRKYIEKYQNTNDANLDVIELYFHLDAVHDFPTITENVSARNPLQITRQSNNVHPSVYGYLHFADAYYNRLLYHLAN